MAVQLDPSVKDDLKTQFVTREGTYRLMTLSEYSRPNRVGYTNSQSSPQVRVSIVTLPSANNASTTVSVGQQQQQLHYHIQHNQQQQQQNVSTLNNSSVAGGTGGIIGSSANATNIIEGNSSSAGLGTSIESRLGVSMQQQQQHVNEQNLLTGLPGLTGGDRFCFNFGKELYIYAFRGVKKCAELSKPIDRKVYKGTNPSCHDFNAASATPEGAPLLVGFTTGQIQLVQLDKYIAPGRREPGKLYNEEKLIDKTKVTCLKWLPGSPNLFLASHSSGHLYLYNKEFPCTPTAPNYQPFKVGDGYTILTCKSKSTRNPLYKWVFGTENCSINEFCFSPCGSNLAIVSQDGFLRVFHYDTMELIGIARSYFGGFLCVCWSPDGKYIVVGGEDDLVTIWSLHERRVVARGQGHRSWVSVVAFDPYTTSYTNWDGPDFSDDENPINDYKFSSGDNGHRENFIECDRNTANSTSHRPNSTSFRDSITQEKFATSYRLGSVSQDTQLCLWDITEDVLRHPLTLRQRINSCNTAGKITTTTTTATDNESPCSGRGCGNDTGDGGGGGCSGGGGEVNNGSENNLNGESINDVKVIKSTGVSLSNNNNNNNNNINSNPTTTVTSSSTTGVTNKTENANNSSNNSSKNSSSNSSSKFSTANCTISPNETGSSLSDSVSVTPITNKLGNSGNSNSSSNNKQQQSNCINNIGDLNQSTTVTTVHQSDGNNKSSSGSSKSSGSSGFSAFNSITQRLSNFSFGGDKKSSSDHYHNSHNNSNANNNNSNRHNHHRKTFSLSKSSGSHHPLSSFQHNNHSGGQQQQHQQQTNNIEGSFSLTSLKNSNSKTSSESSVVTSYDPMKLIGTPACPRFDECPILEPIVCKKIAHERLTALIFREDCFITACQDGFIYTWARPGFSNVPQHMSSSPSAPPGGTVV